MNIPTITTEVPTKFDTFVARSTEIDGRTYSASATEFSDHGEPVSRISLNVHQRDRLWALPSENSPYADHAFGIHGNVVSGTVSIDIGDVSIYLPVGREADVLAALEAAIVEQARQAEADEDTTVVHLTGEEALPVLVYRTEDMTDEQAEAISDFVVEVSA